MPRAIAVPAAWSNEAAAAGLNQLAKGEIVEFLVEFELNIPDGTPVPAVEERAKDEAAAAAKLVHQGHLARLWNVHAGPGQSRILGLYRADSETELEALLRALPLYDWMGVTITALEHHPNDPAATGATT